MADKIKNFFKKKKADAKFRTAGPAHRLSEEQPDRARFSNAAGKAPKPAANRSAPSSEAQQAGAAALSRITANRPAPSNFNTSLAAIQMQVKKELEAEKKAAAAASSTSTSSSSSAGQAESNKANTEVADSPYLAVNGVYFTCPMISAEILTKDEWRVKIKEFLYSQLAEERGLTACLIIHSCNKSKEKVQVCVDTLCKYLENIIKNPGEDKYKRIRVSNRIFKDRVEPIEGTAELLQAAGFNIQQQEVDGAQEEFYVFSDEHLESEDTLQILVDALQTAEPIGMELDRNMQVLLPSQAARRSELPPTFFSLSPEEIKREQQIREEVLEKNLMLRTKAMREKEEQRELRKYRYALVRVRFPDGVLLQGTFTVFEKLGAVVQFVRDHLLEEDQNFVLNSPSGHRLTEEDCEQSLIDLRLIPAVILTFSLENAPANAQQLMYLKPEVMLLVQSL